MDKQAFKQRMQNLKSYRENNPGKGYWDWKVQAYQNGGDIPLWQQYQYSGPSYQDVLDDLKQNSPSTYNQLQQSKAADSQSSSEIVRYVDSKGRLQSTCNLQGLSPVITSDYLPGIGDAMEVTQIVQDVKNEDYGAALAGLGLLALPGNWLSKIKSKYGKKGLVNSIYNNVAPGSYYDSYIPGGSKKDELKGALKDYLLGKGDKIDPKWENWINSPTTLGSFIAKDNKKQQHMLDVMTAARKEAWQNYLGIPHDDRYLINTGIKENGMPVYRSNVTDVPNVQLRDIAKTTQHKPESIPYVHGDMINSTGGNISVKYKDNGDLRTITTEDIWDLNPFKDANRARILPEWLKNKYMHIEVQPDGYQKRVWNDNAPKWLIDLEPANLLGIPGPFLNRTTFNARLLNKDQAVKKVPISKEEYVNKRFGTELELIDPSEMTDKEFQKWKKLTQNRYSEEYDRLNEQQSERLFEFVPKTEEELLDKYGIYVKKYSDGGEVSDPDDEFTKAINTKLGRTPDGRPLQQGLKPVFDLEDAANLTPVGDVLSAKEAYDAVKQNDWLGAGLAGLGFIPFIPKGVRRIARQTPTVNRTFEQKVAEMEKRVSNRRKMMEEFYDQRNRTYELLNTPEARRRAADIDQKYGTEYNKVYDKLTKEYEDITSYVNMVEPEFVKDPDAFARIKPAKSGKKISLSEDNITKPEDFPTGLIRHEIGHYVDEMAYPGGVPNNAYLRQLGKPSKYRPFEEVKDIFRSPDKALQDHRYLRNPTEKKSIMNQFDEYLMNNYTPSTYPQTTKEFKEAIEKAPDIHRNMKLLLKIHNKPSILFKDFKNRPLVNNTTKDKNKELV